MKSQCLLRSDARKPSLSAAITFGSSAAAFLILSFTDGRLLFSFLFAVSFLMCVWEVRGLLREKNDCGQNARQYSEAEYQALGMTRPQKRERSKSQRVIEAILSIAITIIMLYTLTADGVEDAGNVLGAALPLIVLLLDYNAVRFTWREVRQQKFRLTVYALSLLLFLYHLLAALGTVSIRRLLPEQVRFEVEMLLGLAFAPLLLVMICFLIRDTWRRLCERPL